MNILYGLAAIFLIFAAIIFSSFLWNGIMNDNWCWEYFIPLTGCILSGICFIKAGDTYPSKPEIIVTTQPPQIDTTITYSNGVADTVYTYHIIKKK